MSPLRLSVPFHSRHRPVSIGWLALLSALLCLWLANPASAADGETGYEPPVGAAFFLLTDSSFASSEEARVRLEANSENLSAIQDADGVDIALYKVDKPLEFLRKQRNLHRIDVKAAARSEGLANTLSYLWDQWWLRARQTWQNLFDGSLRVAVTKEAPQLKTHKDIAAPTKYVYPSPFRALPGLTEVDRMRYPVPYAKPIAPPKDLKLSGSSSEFTPPQDGNVYIPLGKRQPGLYVVEASAGRHRATALLFVSDTMAVSKTSTDQFFVWTAQRDSGKPSQAQIVWSDLNGVLGSGVTDADGVLKIDHAVPETSYAFGTDAQGGVFITENFYYDSEIYNAKLYAYTDRPLYRPGDEVNVHVYGREFTSATRSTPLAAGNLALTVFDATGSPVHQQTLSYQPQEGASTRFMLPAGAPAGGYEIRLKRGDDEYSAAFRVAPYVKPSFEVLFDAAKPSFKTGEAITGKIRLAYYDGKPVAKAGLSLSARAQVLTMVEGDLIYGGQFPLQIDNNQALTTNDKGEVEFTLPAAKEPSRVILSVLASDGSAQRVRATKELLIERAASAWRLSPQRAFAAPSEAVAWTLTAEPGGGADGAAPTRWVAIHQQSQTRTDGALPATATAPASGGTGAGAGAGANTATATAVAPRRFDLSLQRPGSYTIELRDAQDRLLGAAPFWVSGGELKPPQGSVELVTDKPRYRAGDTARVLITFPDVMDDALLTLERDKVEAYGRLASPRGLAQMRRINDRQWEATLEVRAEHAPNITFSVAYLKGGDFGFQNAGIVVEQPTVQVSLSTDQATYQPGQNAALTITTRDANGKPIAAVVSVGVVDEMVYALQSELAPSVQEFFYHLRRNNVRTHSSQAFISYDEAVNAREVGSVARQRNERAVKMLERPRRDERDTAFFAAAIRTDANGQAKANFVVPDALTRWRITSKAYGVDAADGLVGEKRMWIQSDKPFFAKWTAPTWARGGDKPQASIAVFNQGKDNTPLTLRINVDGQPQTRNLDAKPGASFVMLDLPVLNRDADVAIELRQGDRLVDSLITPLRVTPVGWRGEQELLLPLAAGESTTALSLPADASNLRVRLLPQGAAAWSRVADSLIEYPYGCVEQTASRLVPLALALQSMSGDLPAQAPLRQRLYSARLRLAAMAGPNAVFGWWGHGTTDNAFLSAYAYYADWLATRSLGLSLPAEHWERLLDIYSKSGSKEPLEQQAWTLWLMQQMTLPTATMTDGLIAALAREEPARSGSAPATSAAGRYSPLDLSSAPVSGARDLALVIAEQLARANKREWPATLRAPLDAALSRLDTSDALLPQAVLVAVGKRPATGEALASALARTGAADPTIDRALSLAVLAATQGPILRASSSDLSPKTGWTSRPSPSGQAEFVQAARAPGRDTDRALPTSITWSAPPSTPMMVSVRLNSATRGPSSGREPLKADVERKLFKLVADGDHYRPEALKAGDPLSVQDLYLDEVTVQPREAISFALLELGLPPGANMEPSTWGIQLPGADNKNQPMERAIGEAAQGAYTVPIDALKAGQPFKVRHLVRFAQRGSFQVPAARLWRMYQPQYEVTEAGPAVQAWRIP